MPNYKMLALDIDGTLLPNDGTISDTTIKWVRRAVEAGVTIVLATGRAVQTADPIRQKLDLTGSLVLLNGAEIWAAPGQLLERHFIDTNGIRDMHRVANQYNTSFWASSVHTIAAKKNWTDDMFYYDWMKFGMHHSDLNVIQRVHHIISSWGTYEVTSSHPLNIEIGPKGISKASGIATICNHLDIPMTQVMAIGDSLNDLEMIRTVAFGVAMENGSPVIKEEADAVTTSNDDDGVAHAIKQFLLS